MLIHVPLESLATPARSQTVWSHTVFTLSVRFGSLAAVPDNISLMSALERKAVIREWSFGGVILNVPLSRKRTFEGLENRCFQCPLSANSGRPSERHGEVFAESRMASLCR